ncbi:MAG TPA: hypothetical protein DD708_03680 [Deltaproteobacteria bacterium]|nr:hypothetical protein [Deltaproteobacteria bacterium]
MMSPYSRLFVISSLLYLLVGALMGTVMASFPTWKTIIHFPHAHTMAIGWISMMIFGLAYHVIPRFASSPLVPDHYQRLHLWLANIGMMGMITVPLLQNIFYDSSLPWNLLFFVFGLLQFLGILIFVKNMLLALKFGPTKFLKSMPCCSSCVDEPSNTQFKR